ncbi:MAG: hypothetical protein HF973_13520 [Chloroflexi bacterium]|nr:hypothetical protein [Chloroflexota bacterium]
MKKFLLGFGLFLLMTACSTAVSKPETVNDTAVTASTEMIARTLPENIDAEGHRGTRGLKPENTLPAFETALDLGVDTLELDLHYTSDGVVVLWHDDKIEKDKCRLDPDSDVEAPDPDSLIKWGDALMISQLTLEQLKAYQCDRNPDEDTFPDQDNAPTALAGSNYRPVALAELFDFVQAYSQSEEKSEAQRANAAQVQFNIETKRKPDNPKAISDGFDGQNPGPFELEILRLVDEYGLEDRVIIQSFDFRSIWAIRSVNDTIRLAALSRQAGSADLPEIAAKGANIWSPKYSTLTEPLVSKAHKLGLQVVPWTVNDPDDMRAMLEMGVDGIISDRPDILLGLK